MIPKIPVSDDKADDTTQLAKEDEEMSLSHKIQRNKSFKITEPSSGDNEIPLHLKIHPRKNHLTIILTRMKNQILVIYWTLSNPVTVTNPMKNQQKQVP